MTYLKTMILKPLSVVWIFITGITTLSAIFIDFEQVSWLVKVLVILLISVSTALIIILFQGYKIYKSTRSPAMIRNVIEGSHYYQGSLIIIFDKSPWLSIGQVLVLVQESDNVQIPISLVQIETTTSTGYPQGVILKALSDNDLNNFLLDSSRWNSIFALPDIKSSYL